MALFVRKIGRVALVQTQVMLPRKDLCPPESLDNVENSHNSSQWGHSFDLVRFCNIVRPRSDRLQLRGLRQDSAVLVLSTSEFVFTRKTAPRGSSFDPRELIRRRITGTKSRPCLVIRDLLSWKLVHPASESKDATDWPQSDKFDGKREIHTISTDR
jgi:hypothetical protein